jgi:hypothetical protein
MICIKDLNQEELSDIDAALKLPINTSILVYLKIKELYSELNGLYTSTDNVLVTNTVQGRLDEYRDMFSFDNIGVKGLKTARKECADKMVRVMTEYNLHFEDILDATENYISNCLESNNTDYMLNSASFLEKVDSKGNVTNPIVRWL